MAFETIYCVHCGSGNPSKNSTCFACQRQLPPLESKEDTTFLVGKRYLILAQAGLGGFGTVYKVLDTQEQNTVRALKQITLSNLTPQQAIEATDAFNREVSFLSKLTHIHLPHVYDSFTDPKHWYMVMDFIEGQTLESYLESKGASTHTAQPAPLLSFEEIFSIALQLCDVLRYLHTRYPPIIFRDLKPSNIMRSPSGQIYLIDFGIARHFKPGQAKDTIPFGSPGYAAPEQYGKAQTTRASDIYSLGALLHHLLSGENPAENPFKFIPLYAYGQVGITELATLVEHMVCLDPDNRPSTIAEVQHKILLIASNQGIHTASLIHGSNLQTRLHTPTQPLGMSGGTPGTGQVQVQAPNPKQTPRRRRFSRRAVVFGGVALSLVTIATISSIQSSLNAPKTLQESFLNNPAIIYSSTIAPNGHICVSLASDIFVVWDIHQHQQIWGGEVGIISQIHPAWSPDSQLFANAVGDGSITIWNWQQQQRIQITMPDTSTLADKEPLNDVGTQLAWSSDGKYLAMAQIDRASQRTHFQILDPTTGQVIATYMSPGGAILGLDWSPDSKLLATNNAHDMLHVWEVGTSHQPVYTYVLPQAQVNPPDHNDAVVRWSPDGKWIAAAPYSGPLSIWSPTTNQGIIIEDTTDNKNLIYLDLAWSPDGGYLAAADTQNTIRFWNMSTRQFLGTVAGAEPGYGGPRLHWQVDNRSVIIIDRYRNIIAISRPMT